MLLVEACHVVLRVVIDLEGVAAWVDLEAAVQASEALQHVLELGLVPALIHVTWSIHCKDDPYIDLALEVAGVVVIGESAEMQSLHKCMDLACDITKIDWRAYDKGIGLEDPVKKRRQIIFPEAMASLEILALADQTASSACVVEIEEVDVFNLRTY